MSSEEAAKEAQKALEDYEGLTIIGRLAIADLKALVTQYREEHERIVKDYDRILAKLEEDA